MPTALSCFADALRSGADYVTSDAVFGYSGVTTLYHSQGFAACPGCALVSRELLRRCQAEARDPENPVEAADAGSEAPPQPRLPPAGAGPL